VVEERVRASQELYHLLHCQEKIGEMASQVGWYGEYGSGIQAPCELSESMYAYEALGAIDVSLVEALSNLMNTYLHHHQKLLRNDT
jgi:hypothetical protein